MCTAATYLTKDFYFGRTLDYEFTYGEQVTVVPRYFPLPFRNFGTLDSHYAMIGMAHIADDTPLFYDAANEKGLCAAALNFVGYAHYTEPNPEKDNICHFELIQWVLSQCRDINEASELLQRAIITDEAFNDGLPPSPLHWIFSDRTGSITVESVTDGLQIYSNPTGILTNSPPFETQMFQLRNYMGISPKQPENHFSDRLELMPYSRGMGAMGLPGDLSSQSRFIRAAFTKLNSVSGDSEHESLSQFFHILDTVGQTRGCCEVDEGKYEITVYSSCCNADKGIYYYTTYDNRQITAVHMHREDLNAKQLFTFPLIQQQQIKEQN